MSVLGVFSGVLWLEIACFVGGQENQGNLWLFVDARAVPYRARYL